MKRGTHGTCNSYAKEISDNGFKASTGKIVKGVYFWAYFDDETEFYARDLATSWWLFSKSKGRFKRADDDSCAVVFVEIHLADDESYLDLEDPDLKSKFIAFANTVYKKHGQRKLDARQAIEATYDLFVNMMKEKLEIEFELVHVRISPPSRDYYRCSLPLDITGAPSCFVALNTNCLNIREIETC